MNMISTWIYSLVSVLIVSLVSLIGVLFLFFKESLLRKILFFLVSLSAGVLLGNAFFHLIPEVFEEFGSTPLISLFILSGILLFFILEKFLHWRHCHLCYPAPLKNHSHPAPFAYTNLVGDALHNFIDGIIIAGSFLISPHLGITTTLAVIFHEVPQEIGDFGVLIQAGFNRTKALIFNFLSALTAFGGTVLILVLESQIEKLSLLVLSLTIGGFIYIACADLIPELHKEYLPKKSFGQLLFLVLGMSLMALLTLK